MLFAEEVPASGGGETEFADMRAAWEALDAETKARISSPSMAAFHSSEHSTFRVAGLDPATFPGYGYDGNAPLRPLVKTHPETGRRSIFVASHAFQIPGMTPEDSAEIFDGLVEFACVAPRTYLHRWQPGSLVVWDNRCMLHRARPYKMTEETRRLRGTRVAGEESESGLPVPQEEGRRALAAAVEALRRSGHDGADESLEATRLR